MKTTSETRVVLIPDQRDPCCALCREPYDPVDDSPFEMVSIDGKPVCPDCGDEHYALLFALIESRVHLWPHDLFALPADERETFRRQIQDGVFPDPHRLAKLRREHHRLAHVGVSRLSRRERIKRSNRIGAIGVEVRAIVANRELAAIHAAP